MSTSGGPQPPALGPAVGPSSSLAASANAPGPPRGSEYALAAATYPIALLAHFTGVKYLPLMPLRRETPATKGRRRGQYPSKTNSERGKAFRAKQRQYEVDLTKALTSLQSEIYDLQVVRNARSECALQTRTACTGSLLKLAREYHALFYMGIPDRGVGERRLGASGYQDLLARQRLYLEHAFDPDFRLGGRPGMATIFDDWKRYSQYHGGLSMRAHEFEACGTDEKPVVVAYGTIRVRYTRRTLECVFPHVFHDASLMQRFVGKEVVYTYQNVYEFNEDGRILVYDTVVDFVQPLLDAGSSMDGVSRLMRQARIADQYKLGSVDDGDTADVFSMVDEDTQQHDLDSNDMPGAAPRETPARTSSKHKMDFILS